MSFLLLLFGLTAVLPPAILRVDARDLPPTAIHLLSGSEAANSDRRSIWDIVWSCLAVIFACAWVAVHPNIPSSDRKNWRRSLRRLQYMVYTILVPEIVLYWAMTQYLAARRYAGRYRDRGWTTTHAHFLQMGGFVLFDGDTSVGVIIDTFSTWDVTLDSAYHLNDLVQRGEIQFPTITKQEIEDKSKSDGLSKAVAIGQTAWFILQCIVRVAEGLDITQLELITLALAALNALMYFFWWDKPYNVQTQIPVRLLKRREPRAADEESNMSERPSGLIGAIVIAVFKVFEHLGQMTELTFSSYKEFKKGHVPMFYSLDISQHDPQSEKRLLLISTIGIAFGAIHIAGWNIPFPTKTELTIWRISSVLIGSLACVPAVQALTELLSYGASFDTIRRSFRFVQFHLERVFKWVMPVYLGARLLLVVLALISLRRLPPGAYAVVSWTTDLPHI